MFYLGFSFRCNLSLSYCYLYSDNEKSNQSGEREKAKRVDRYKRHENGLHRQEFIGLSQSILGEVYVCAISICLVIKTLDITRVHRVFVCFLYVVFRANKVGETETKMVYKALC